MKRVFGGLFMVLVLSSFVFATSSDVTAHFVLDQPREGPVDYVPSQSVLGDCLGYFILVFIALAFIYFIVKSKKAPGKKRAKKKSSKRKK